MHRNKDPERLDALVSVYLGFEAELEEHMAKEEQILFPTIQQGLGAMAGGPISVMVEEHVSAASALRRLRELTDDYRVPGDACTPGERSGTVSRHWRSPSIVTYTSRTTSSFPAHSRPEASMKRVA